MLGSSFIRQVKTRHDDCDETVHSKGDTKRDRSTFTQPKPKHWQGMARQKIGQAHFLSLSCKKNILFIIYPCLADFYGV